ncbi:MAG: shikimate dehydrogenase [Actinomycetota bacterium]
MPGELGAPRRDPEPAPRGPQVVHSPISGTTRVVGLIGWPVGHSLSPVVHNAAFAALGLDWVYLPLPVRPDGIERAVAGLSALGLAGANVTMPHKEAVAGLVTDLSEDAGRLRAVNTLVVAGDEVMGHNTDAPGFGRFLAEDAAFDAAGRAALVLGSGGAARAFALALGRAGAATVTIAARVRERAVEATRCLSGLPVEARALRWEEARGVEADVVVNATPVEHPDHLPLPPLGETSLVVDLRYQPPVTRLVAAAREAGAAAFGGLGLLIHQAALSFELWTGQLPPAGVMSAAALAALAEPLV